MITYTTSQLGDNELQDLAEQARADLLRLQESLAVSDEEKQALTLQLAAVRESLAAARVDKEADMAALRHGTGAVGYA